VLCLAGTGISTASAASRLTTSSSTALTSCLQQEYLMRDAYQDVLAKYPTLAAFGTVMTGDVAMITSVKKVFAQYRITVPTDAEVSAAKTIAATVTSISNAGAVAISLEQSTATLMTQLSRTTDNRDVANLVTLIKIASLSSLHTTAFATEQMSVFTPTPTPTPTPTQRIVSFTPDQSAATLLALLGDESVDVIELNGTYSFTAPIYLDIERTRPVVVRPAAGATVVFSGTNIPSGAGQFEIGDHGKAGNITMQGITFDGYVLQQIGIFHIFNAHDITLNDMVVRNSRANGTTALPYHSWAVYITSTATVIPTNITVNHWTVDGSARGMSALQVYGGSHIIATNWSVAHAYFALYACSDRGPLTDFTVSDWTINDTSSSGNTAVYFERSSGTYSSLHANGSGALVNSGSPTMTNGGGNSL
jgi:hypothetical protein